MERKLHSYSYQLFVLIFFALCIISCHRGTGCPAEDTHVKLDKHGNPKGKPQSGIFNKKMQKKMKHK